MLTQLRRDRVWREIQRLQFGEPQLDVPEAGVVIGRAFGGEIGIERGDLVDARHDRWTPRSPAVCEAARAAAVVARNSRRFISVFGLGRECCRILRFIGLRTTHYRPARFEMCRAVRTASAMIVSVGFFSGSVTNGLPSTT